MMRMFLRIYWGPILAIIAFLVVAVLMTGGAYLQAIRAMLQDPAWWADATFSVIVFTVLISWVVGLAARNRQRQERTPFEGWQVRVKTRDKELFSPLYWEEVRRFKNSPLEERRFIQSVLSSQGEWLESEGLDLVQECDWVERNDEAREYVIDLMKFRTRKQKNGESGSE